MQDSPTLRIAADVRELATIRDFVETQAAAFGVDEHATYDLVLAANEIATNIVVHGYRGQAGAIEIQMRCDGDTVTVALRDQAPLFDPTTAPTPDTTAPLELRRPGGMGIHLTRRLMEEMLYRATSDGGNETTLVKRGAIADSTKE